MTQAEALKILKTGRNVFLTGAAGSGKTYVLSEYIKYLKKHGVAVAVTASTGIAATHLGGITIHSWCGMGIKDELSAQQFARLARNRKLARRVTSASVLIIDEISMLDASRLALVARVVRYLRGNLTGSDPQIVMCGDFFQLPPITANDSSPVEFAFEGHSWQTLNPAVCYLQEQHRQQDSEYLEILQAIRSDNVASHILSCLRGRLQATIASVTPARLFSHNIDVDEWNNRELTNVPGVSRQFAMESRGNAKLVESLRKSCLAPELLKLKKGAAVMFVKNDFDRGVVNGTLGTVLDFDGESGYPLVRTKNGKVVVAMPASWSIDDENEKILAEIKQIPLRLAWAMTIHKSQGMSMDAAEIDLSDAFTPGMGYVALSRVRTLSGLRLLGLNQTALQVDNRVSVFDSELQRLSAQEQVKLISSSPADITKQHEAFIHKAGGKIFSQHTTQHEQKQKTYSVEILRKTYPSAYASWSESDDIRLRALYTGGTSVKELAIIFERKTGAISSRLKKLRLTNI